MSVEISPATTTSPVVISVSQATRPSGSSDRTASRTESEIWSATLSGCPSVTDSEVNRNSRAAMGPQATQNARLLDAQEERDLELVRAAHGVLDRGAQRLQVPRDAGRDPALAQPLDDRDRAVDVDVQDDLWLGRETGAVGGALVLRALRQALAAGLGESDSRREVAHDEPAVHVRVVQVLTLGKALDEPAEHRGSIDTVSRRRDERDLRHLPAGRADIEGVLTLQNRVEPPERSPDPLEAGLLQDRVRAEGRGHPFRAMEREIEQRIPWHELLQAAVGPVRRHALLA